MKYATTKQARLTLVTLLVVWVGTLCMPVQAAAPAKPASSATATQAPQDTFRRDTPRGTMQGFMQALAQNDWALAINYIDVNNNKNPSATIQSLKAALDSGGRINEQLQISNDPAGNLDDKLPPNLDKVGEINAPNTNKGSIDILLQRVKQNNGTQVWLISQQTLQQVSTLSPNAKPTLVERYVPKKWLDEDIKGYSVGHIAAVIALLFATYVLSLLISQLFFWLFRTLYLATHPDKDKRFPIDGRVVVPAAMVITGVIIKELMIVVGINLVARNVVSKLADMLSWVALAWLLLRIMDLVFKRAENYASNNNHPERLSVLNLLRKVVKVILLAIAAIVILGNLGFDLTTGIAALGIGGVALALGAQKTIENLVGSVSVVADQPVNVGDYCRFGSQEGTVEDIGIRSTRLRTTDRTVVTIPNGNFSSMSIENVSKRDMFHFSQVFYVSRDSDIDKLKEFLEQTQIYITNHPDTNSMLNQVRISGTQQDAYLVEVRCYMTVKGVMDFNQKQTEMILQIAELMQDVGLKNALPTSRVMMGKPIDIVYPNVANPTILTKKGDTGNNNGAKEKSDTQG
ncbi:MAG: mechanosensitive ion channel family protein [Moraxella sp.]|jgi:MscS family membrane protein